MRLYKQGPKSIDEPGNADYKKSVMFLSQAGRYYTVGAIGLLLNYVVSILFTNSFNDRFAYLDGTVVGIIFSIHSNFIMNKVWTFMDRNFTLKHLLRQYGMFIGISSFWGNFTTIICISFYRISQFTI